MGSTFPPRSRRFKKPVAGGAPPPPAPPAAIFTASAIFSITASAAASVVAGGSTSLAQVQAATVGQWGQFTGTGQTQSYLPPDSSPPFNSPSAGANEWGLLTVVLPSGEKLDITVLGHTGFCAHKGLKSVAGTWAGVGAAPSALQIAADFDGTTDKRYSTGLAALEANHGHAYKRGFYDTTISKVIIIKGAVPYPQATYSGDVFVYDPTSHVYLTSGTAPNIGFTPLAVDDRIAKVGRGFYLMGNGGNSQQQAYHPVTGTYLYAELGWGNGVPAAFFYDPTRGATGHGQTYSLQSSGGNYLFSDVRRFDQPATNTTYNAAATSLDWSSGAPVIPDNSFLVECPARDSIIFLRPNLTGEIWERKLNTNTWNLIGSGGTVPAFPANGVQKTLTFHSSGSTIWLEGSFLRNTGNDYFFKVAA